MKRMTILLALLLAVMLAAAGAMPWGLPDAAQLVPGPTEGENGAVMVAENRWLSARVYTLRGGQVSAIYRESRIRNGGESRIARAAAWGNEACFLRILGEGTAWELVKLDNGAARVLCRGVTEAEVRFTGVRVLDGSCWITTVDGDQTIRVYEYTPSGQLVLSLLVPDQQIGTLAAAEYDGQVLRATDGNGEPFLYQNGQLTYSADGAQAPLPTVTARGSGWLICKRDVLLAALLLWLVIAVTTLVAGAVSRRGRRVANRLTAVGGAVMLLALLAAAGTAFTVARMTGGLTAARQAALLALPAAGILWLLTLVLLRATAGRISRPLSELRQQMDRVAEGDVKAREASSGKDELSRMDRSLQMMCMNLSVFGYESVCTIRSYQRFVPEKMPELLDRPVAEEIQLGDSRRMVGNVGVFSVGNRAEARNTLDDGAFVDFINHSFGIFHDCIEENHGWMLSSALRLSDMEALFPDSPADGVRAGLDFLGKLQVSTGGDIPAPRACLILHRASFLYGIAGQEKRLFPYLSSSELEFLNGYARRFDEAGVRIVATEAYWKQLEGCGFTGRYIGFVSAGERGGAYKLYEVLDAYPELERELRRGYDQRFQEAVNLFYHNDFYLARNLFSTLLRACPGDGIARWYLFACERFFNQEGGGEPDFSLFGVEEA